LEIKTILTNVCNCFAYLKKIFLHPPVYLLSSLPTLSLSVFRDTEGNWCV
jgi:hypothetical protein